MVRPATATGKPSRRVAARAATSDRIVVYYFPTKGELIAAVASWSRGADPVHSADDAGPFGAPEGEGIDALDATPLAEEWSPA